SRIDNDANIDSTFNGFLKSTCDKEGADFFHNLDNTTDTTFDNASFTNLLNNKGLLHSDQELFSGGSTDAEVRAYSTNSAAFFSDFGNAMIKMGSLDVLTRSLELFTISSSSSGIPPASSSPPSSGTSTCLSISTSVLLQCSLPWLSFTNRLQNLGCCIMMELLTCSFK
ncbi:PREDICTED: cationic peroxidase 1-like, partial [Nelumbo nucifera]|uniref:Cationic peroxidase 1-like n=1 Tax=Nelumbo nucifera TaxID=4432 RepID=A0A1U7Z8S3_NELNU